jgi:hypothetical protein
MIPNTKTRPHAKRARMPRMGRLSDMLDPNKLKALLNSVSPEELRAVREAVNLGKNLSQLPDGLWSKVVSYLGQPPKKRGRPLESAKRKMWAKGARLKDENPSWPLSRVTRKLDPEEFSIDPRRATDRMRQGILTIQKEAKARRHGKTRSLPPSKKEPT